MNFALIDDFPITRRIGEVLGLTLPFDARALDTFEEMTYLVYGIDKPGETKPPGSPSKAERLELFRTTARDITAHCDTDTCKIASIFSWVKSHLIFRNDPVQWIDGRWQESEVLYRPENLLIKIQKEGKAYGDCDDFTTLLATLYRAAGLKPGLCTVETGRYPGEFDHVFPIVYNRDTRSWVSTDGASTRQDWTGQRFHTKELLPMATPNAAMIGTYGKGFSAGEVAVKSGFDWNNFFQGVFGTLQSKPWYKEYGPGMLPPPGTPGYYPQQQAPPFAGVDSTTLLVGLLIVAGAFAVARR